MQNEIDMLLARTEEAIAKLRDDLRLEERLRDRLLEVKGQRPIAAEGTPPVQAGNQVPSNNGGHRPAGSVVAGSLLSHVTAILQEAGRAMKAGEIAERVQARGYETSAKGGLKIAVATVLAHNRAKVFRKVSPGVYALKHPDGQEPAQQGGEGG